NPLLVPIVHGWPITEMGRAAIAAIMSGATVLSVGCEAVPPPMLTQLPQLRTIEVADDTVVIRFDADGVGAGPGAASCTGEPVRASFFRYTGAERQHAREDCGGGYVRAPERQDR